VSEPARKAIIHDLSYRRYAGARRAQRTRYRVIVRDVVRSAWRGWWRMKLWIIGALIATGVMQAVMYFVKGLSEQFGAPSGAVITVADATLPVSILVFRRLALVLTITIGTTVVSRDLRTGAFEFYFARSVRPIDYVAGKLLGLILVMGTILFVGPLLVAAFRVGMAASDVESVPDLLIRIPQSMLIGAIATVALAVAPLAFSVISSTWWHGMVAWAAFYVIATSAMVFIASKTGVAALAGLDIGVAIDAIAFEVYDVRPLAGGPDVVPPLWAAIGSLAVYTAAGLGAVYWRVAHAQRAGLGGG
jgi:ABC-type transport system involved in multi-copper enzyme maturation permease subunit